ncbi:MAG: GspH/FimT family pseudopilin [Pseudomonas sp.]|nr:GspH/FimT family pseudopilin [Pseudomonas sp.]
MSLLKKMRGFTLIELMITVVLLAIVATIAVPNFTQFIQNNQVQAKAEELKTFLQYARNEALTRRKAYTVRINDTAWQLQTKGGVVVRTLEFNPAQAQARTNAVNNSFIFSASGDVSREIKVTVCRDQDNATGYLLEVRRSGLIKMQARGQDVPSQCAVST